MSENILNDLKKAGSDNMSNLIEMMSQFKEREASAVEEWNFCRPGRFALGSALERSFDCEVALRSGYHCGAIRCLASFYEFETFVSFLLKSFLSIQN